MPPRPFTFDLTRRGSYVCKACLDTLRPAVNARPWLPLARQSSSSISRKTQPTPLAPNKDKGQAFPDPEQLQRVLEEELEHTPSTPSLDPLDVKYFQQQASGKLRRLRDNDEFAVASGGMDSEIEETIDKLEKQMVDTLKMLNRMEKGGRKDKADELRNRFKRTIRLQYKGKTGPEGEQYGLLRIAGFSGPRQRTVANLNAFLARDSVVIGGIPKPGDLAACWKFYSAARKTLATAWENVPKEVWDFLWMTLSYEGEGVENPNRMQHLYILAKDMQAAGVPLRDSQQLLSIEAMFIEGWEVEAIEAWKKAVVMLGAKPETFTDYWELGVRMCALHGDTERAQRAADTLLKSSQPPNAHILVPIIRAQAAKKATVDQAWESYRDMRTLLGESMTIEDYDEIIAIFLTSDRVEYALQAFVDMMLSGTVDIRGKTRLPMRVGNHFFIGKWLKRLIGVGDLEGAYKVVVFVQSKGIIASAVQLNGLIGAWLRSGAADNVEKADALAWSMIQARLDFVKMRHRRDVVQVYDPYSTPMTTEQTEGEPKFVCHTRATAETFSLLAENYCSRRLHTRLKELFEVLKKAEIGPTSYLMNQLIRSHSQNGEVQEAVNLYHTMTWEQHIPADGHTFLTLFNSLSVNRLIQRDPTLSKQDITSGRGFFKDMVETNWTFDTPEIFAQLPRTILFTMLKTKDYAGMMVAARAMREIFAFHPTENLLLELASGLGSLQVKSKRNMERVMGGRRTIEGLMKRHRMELIKDGHPGDEMSEEEKITELHVVLEQFIVLKAGAQDVDPKEMHPAIEEAAREMGVYDIVLARDAEQTAKRRKLNRKMIAGMV
ncbi:hypothetical protein N0V88_004391 [Collariella sp. IMI 366227]|nr:hypothetical protein N0V88_004391 [Collariella sp. IMI 366227]